MPRLKVALTVPFKEVLSTTERILQTPGVLIPPLLSEKAPLLPIMRLKKILKEDLIARTYKFFEASVVNKSVIK